MKQTTPFELEFDELLDTLPLPVLLEDSCWIKNRSSCFITISGFEPRCFAAANALADRKWEADLGFCIHYAHEDMVSINNQFKEKLYAAMQQITGGKTPIPINDNDHNLEHDFGSHLIETLRSSGIDLQSASTTIVFDITVGSTRVLLEALYALLNTSVSLILVYSEASDYRPLFDEYLKYSEDSKQKQLPAPEFLTQGVDKVEILKGIPGRDADARPTYLAAVPSFSAIRMDAVLQELSPSRVHWLFGIPHLVRNRWRIDAQRDYHSLLIEQMHRRCYVSTFDYRETLAVLEAIYRKRKNDYSMLICSFGSKLQKVGQVLFHLMRPEVGAIISVPKVWNHDRYSDESPRAVFSIDLGECANLRTQVWRTRTFRV